MKNAKFYFAPPLLFSFLFLGWVSFLSAQCPTYQIKIENPIPDRNGVQMEVKLYPTGTINYDLYNFNFAINGSSVYFDQVAMNNSKLLGSDLIINQNSIQFSKSTSGSFNTTTTLFRIHFAGDAGAVYMAQYSNGGLFSGGNLCFPTSTISSTYTMQSVTQSVTITKAPLNDVSCSGAYGRAIPDASIEVTEGNFRGFNIPVISPNGTTDNFGSFNCRLSPTSAYRFRNTKTHNLLCGVCPDDLDFMKRFVLSSLPFDYLWQYLASDLTGDRIVTTADIIQLRRILLKLQPSVPVSSWRIARTSDYHLIPTPITGNLSNIGNLYQATYDYNVPDPLSFTFYGIKIGDPTGDCVSCTSGANPCIIEGPPGVTGETPNMRFATGTQIVLPVKPTANNISGTGFQFTLKINPNYFNILGVTTNLVSVSPDDFLVNIDHSNGKVYISYMKDDLSTQTFNSSTTLFNLILQPIQSGSSLVGLIEKDNDEINYWLHPQNGVQNTAFSIGSYLGGAKVSQSGNQTITVTEAFHIQEVGEVRLDYFLTQPEPIEITFYDINGQLLKQFKQDGIEGLNEVRFSHDIRDNLSVIIYHIRSGKQSLSGKLLVK